MIGGDYCQRALWAGRSRKNYGIHVGERDRGVKSCANKRSIAINSPTGEVCNFEKNSSEYRDYECM